MVFWNISLNYSLESFANEIKDIFKTYNYPLTTETNTPSGLLKIVNPGTKSINLDQDLAHLLGINRKLKYQTTCEKAFISSSLFYSLRFDRQNTESVQSQKVRSFSRGWCEREALWKGNLPQFSAAGFTRVCYQQVYKLHEMVNSLISRAYHFVLNES